MNIQYLLVLLFACAAGGMTYVLAGEPFRKPLARARMSIAARKGMHAKPTQRMKIAEAIDRAGEAFEKVIPLKLSESRELQDKLDEVHITINKNAIPNDPQKPGVTSGVRIGTPACTTRGFTPEDMPVVADCIDKIATDFESNRKAVLAAVAELVRKHPIYE